MSEESTDDSSKTEEPSQKRLDEARKKGQMVSTRELNHFFMMLALTFFIFVLAPTVAYKTINVVSPFITHPDEFDMSSAGVTDTFRRAAMGLATILLLPLIATTIAAIAPSILQGKWVFAAEQIRPKLEKISPLSGFKRIYGMKAFVEFIKSLLKVGVIGTAAVMSILPYMHDLPQLSTEHKAEMLIFAQAMAGRMMIAACVFLFLLSIVDYVYQRFIFMKQMRMSKQEVKDEHKQQEGDPHIKGKIKQQRRERARRRMMANVPKADVIITNPTHYAVALKYDSSSMRVPKVMAKGADDVAARIREVAEKNRIPIIRNPPLARVLYDSVEVEDDIPIEHYQAVAKIIGYVYRLKGKPLQKQTIKRGKPKR